jgi:hypothetical protein
MLKLLKMRKEDLENALGNNKLTFSNVKFTELNNIMQYVNVKLCMDSNSFDYLYEINVSDLLNSKMPSNDLDDLKKEGWSFNATKDKIILFLKK